MSRSRSVRMSGGGRAAPAMVLSPPALTSLSFYVCAPLRYCLPRAPLATHGQRIFATAFPVSRVGIEWAQGPPPLGRQVAFGKGEYSLRKRFLLDALPGGLSTLPGSGPSECDSGEPVR